MTGKASIVCRDALLLASAGLAHFVLASAGLAAATFNPIASPVWPATGVALAAVLLLGYRAGPVIWASAFVANLLVTNSVPASAAIAFANLIEALLTAYLLQRWSGGTATFDTAGNVFRFVTVCALSGPVVSATAGSIAVIVSGHGEWTEFARLAATWWMADLSGALLVTPVIVLWLGRIGEPGRRPSPGGTLGAVGLAAAIGIIVFSPIIDRSMFSVPLAFLAIVPLLWAAFRGSRRVTAAVALVLAASAVWGVAGGGGPFLGANPDHTYLLLQSFVVSMTIPSLALSSHVAEHLRAESSLRARTRELEAVLATVPAAVWVARGDGAPVITGNQYAAQMLRLAPEDNQSLTAPQDERPAGFRVFRDGDELQPEQLPVQRASHGEEVDGEVLELRFEDGTTLWEIVNATPLRDEDGGLVGAVGAAMDVTERMETERRQRLLLDELDHRAKNMIATMQAIVRLTLGSTPQATAVLGRLGALARAHDRWKRSWRGMALRELVTEALQPFAAERGDIRLTMRGPDVVLHQRATERMSLILYELATNAAKYGALSTAAGRIEVAWTETQDGGLSLVWRESGGPAVAPPRQTGVGTTLIRSGLDGGESELDFAPSGLSCRLQLRAGTWERTG